MQAIGASPDDHRGAVHLAVMQEPWLSHVVAGRKTIESRFSRAFVPPHGLVKSGDLVVFKRVSGAICATAGVARVDFHDLHHYDVARIRDQLSSALCADATFWAERRYARFATLMHLCDVREVPEVHVVKRDRRGWVVLKDNLDVHADQLQFGLESPSAPARRAVDYDDRETKRTRRQLTLPGLLAA